MNKGASQNDVGLLCPPPPPPPPPRRPPPPPPPQSNAPYTHHHQPIQSMHPMPPANVMPHRGYQQQHNAQYQQYQTGHQPALQPQLYHYQQQPQQPHYNQYSYSPQYTNNHAAPPPPPPPPPPSRHAVNRYNNNVVSNNTNPLMAAAGRNAGHNSINANNNVAASLRQSLSPKTKTAAIDASERVKPQEKGNPKMVKKYAGRGLKRITISGPGMPSKRFMICVGDHPEDIRKWIEERKKRFPRMDGSHKNNNGPKEGDVGGGNVIDQVMVELSGEKRSRQPEEGQENMAQKRTCPDEKVNNEGTVKGGLPSLLSGYGSSSEDEVPTTKETSPTGVVPLLKGDNCAAVDTVRAPKPTRTCRFYQRGKCQHGTSCKFLHSEATATAPNDVDQRQKQNQLRSERDKARNERERELQILGLATPSHGSRYTSGGKVINSTSLLHKLLQRDKERERRLALQLLRYITDCDYFQAGNTNTSNDVKVDLDAAKQP